MVWSGGNYTKGNNATGGWTGDASLGIGIEAGRHDTQDNDFATGINQCLNKDGSNAATGNINAGGFRVVNVAAGTAAAPAVCAGNDVNTGIFSPAADEIGIATNGTEKIRINSTGKLGVGTTSPTYNVDIQTTDGANLSMGRFDNTNAGPVVLITKSRGASIGTNTIVQNADQLGAIVFQGANGTSYTSGAVIQAFVDGTPGASSDMPTRITFATSADGSGSPTERMRIDSSGNIGLGGATRNAAIKLDIKGRIAVGSGNSDAEVNWTRPTTADQTAWDLAVRTDVGGSNEDLKLLRFISNTYQSIAVQIQNTTGDVGINTTPSARLHVVTPYNDTNDFMVGNNIGGNYYFRSNLVYRHTSASSANVFVDSVYPGVLVRSTSSAEYKKDIEDLDPQYADKLMEFRPVWYRSTCEIDNPNHSHYGFIAEEIAEIDPRFVQFGYSEFDYEEVEITNDDGSVTKERKLKEGAKHHPVGVAYDKITTFLTSIIQRQEKRLAALEAKVAELKA